MVYTFDSSFIIIILATDKNVIDSGVSTEAYNHPIDISNEQKYDWRISKIDYVGKGIHSFTNFHDSNSMWYVG